MPLDTPDSGVVMHLLLWPLPSCVAYSVLFELLVCLYEFHLFVFSRKTAAEFHIHSDIRKFRKQGF